MLPDWEKAIVKITSTDSENSSFGTGFIFYKDGKYVYLLTCAHVVRNVGGENQVKIADDNATVVYSGKEDRLDLAVLQVTGLIDRPSLKLCTNNKRDIPIVVAGFQLLHGNYLLFRPLRGNLGEPVGIETRDYQERISAWELEFDENRNLQHGYSGAPVINEKTGLVLGVTSLRLGEGRKGLAISVEALKDVWPDTPVGLLDDNRTDQERNLVAKKGNESTSYSGSDVIEQVSTTEETRMTYPTIFVSYSHKDEKEKDYLLSHLAILEHARLIDLWSDDQIRPGSDWKEEIGLAMDRATVAIFLVTANFLTSELILNTQVATVLQRKQHEGLIVFPIIARDCAWQKVEWLSRMRVRPKNGNPVWGDNGSHLDEDLAAIAREIADIVEWANKKDEASNLVSSSISPEPMRIQKHFKEIEQGVSDLDPIDLDDRKKERLRQKLATLQDEWDLRIEKIRRIKRALAIETNVNVKFQLEYSQKDEENILIQLASELDEIEQELR